MNHKLEVILSMIYRRVLEGKIRLESIVHHDLR
jgi:hypothetical protein